MEPIATSCPQDVLDWIAWYPEGLLPDPVRGRIEAHAAECSRCRSEIEMLRTGAEPETAAPVPDADAVFAHVLARIEDDATNQPRRTPLRAAPRAATRGGQLARRGALAAALALVFASGSMGAGLGAWLGAASPEYRTATAAVDAGPRLDAVLRENAEFGQLESGLRAIGGSLVSGPSAGGRVQIALPAASDPDAAAARLREHLGEAALLVAPAIR